MEKQKMKDCATVWRRAWCANWQPKQMFLLYANHKTAALNGSLYVNRSCSDVREKRSYLVEVSGKCWVFFRQSDCNVYHQKGGRLCVCVIYMQQKPWHGRRVFRGLAWRFTPAVFVVWLVMAFTTARTESSSRWGTQSSHHNSAVVCNKASLERKRKDNVFGIFFSFSILTKWLLVQDFADLDVMPSITLENNVIHNNEGYGVILVKPSSAEYSSPLNGCEGRHSPHRGTA